VAQLLVFLLVSSVEGRFIGSGILVGDGQHLLGCPEILHGELADDGRVPESHLEEHDDEFIINIQDDISLVAEMLDKLSGGLSLLLYNAGQVLVNSWSCARV
jgi:hypothetical protein